MNEEIKNNIIEGMKLLEENRVLNNAKKAIEQNIERMTILSWLNAGMDEVGKLYESEEYYIIELIMSEIIYTQVLALDGFDLPGQYSCGCKGTIVLGTVKGDHHDIGKNIFKCMAEASGITVHDLGVDVQRGDFIDAIRQYSPDIVAFSVILTSLGNEVKNLVEKIRNEFPSKDIKILMGGSAFSKSNAIFTQVDAFAKDASNGVNISLQWLSDKGGKRN